MATHKLNKAITSTWDIDENRDIWILGEKGRITGTGISGIRADETIAKATVLVNGKIDLGGSSYGMYLEAGKCAVTLADTARISAGSRAIYYSNDTGTVTIDNDGQLQGNTGIFALAKQDRATIGNTGRIDASGNGILAIGAGADIVNSGVIKADSGIQAAANAGDVDCFDAERATHLTNSGKVTGLSYSIYTQIGFDVAVNLRNKGALNGDIRLGAGEDVVNNRGGTINGDVRLGSNHDHFDGRGGRLNGVLYGGDGNDVVTLASPATLYVELAGEGQDQVRINATYRLGANVDHLTLLGKGDHAGIGNSLSNAIYGNKGDNALYGLDGNDLLWSSKGRDRLFGGDGGDNLDGGKGNDTLTGGAGDDAFVFFSGCGHDRIMDFEPGIDTIRLIGFDGLASVDDLKMWTSPSGDVVIRLNDTDRLVLRDTDINALSDGDFIF